MLVDTNVISELMRPRPAASVVDWAERQESMSLSVITLEEVLAGLSQRPSERLSRWFQRFVLDYCEILPITASIARRCARLRGEFRRMGKQRTQADMLIAATALEHNLALATRNTKDFAGCGIAVVNPFELPTTDE
jgi:predicted nucleic acid-binding protein